MPWRLRRSASCRSDFRTDGVEQGRGSEEAVFGLQMPRGNRRPVMAGFRFEGGSVGRRPASPGQAWRG
jgi:hypothetical protein